MHTPSPQLLRALRTTLNTRPILRFNPTPSIPHRNTSTAVRPTRMIPRSHTHKPATHDRGPQSEESTQTDFNALNVLGGVEAPTTGIDACLDSGFHLNSGLKITGRSGLMLVGGEAFAWRPWKVSEGKFEDERAAKAGMINAKGQFELGEEAWGLLSVVWPRPDMLILGLGASMYPLSPETKRQINSLGIRVDIQDTRNAAAQFNLLATERGVNEIAAAMLPISWKGRS
ncbi:hypothetical protein N7490_011234 [Penicillium lividum]|nr:hypothetical protein N7490_011234 [Penicillium lividum]